MNDSRTTPRAGSPRLPHPTDSRALPEESDTNVRAPDGGPAPAETADAARTRYKRTKKSARLSGVRLAGLALMTMAIGGVVAGCGSGDDSDEPTVPAPDLSVVPAPSAGANPAEAPSTFEREFAHTPVVWHRWGDEAFDLARRLNRPVFALIGYSSCPWCAKMRRESFEDPGVAELLNTRFVPVLVDAELRPDLNRAFMRYLQATKRTAGWPLCTWITPDRLPISAGTYFPVETTAETPSFRTMLEHISSQWIMFPDHYREQTERDIKLFVDHVTGSLGIDAAADAEPWFPSEAVMDAAYAGIAGEFDPANGGFASRPKFLFPPKIDFLLEFASDEGGSDSYRAQQALRMVQTTLDHVIRSSLRDHLHGGFFRYSLDTGWNAPNFEKTLIDQALVAAILFKASRITGDERYRAIGLETLVYIEQTLKDPAGGYRSGEAAESLSTPTDGDPAAPRVGAFRTWSSAEIDALLPEADLAVFRAVYEIRERGNIPPGCNIRGDLDGRNTLFIAATPDEAAARLERDPDEVRASIERSLGILREAASERPRPAVDEKVLLPWNASLVGAFVEAYHSTQDPRHLEAARALATFLVERFFDPASGRLFRGSFAGVPATEAIYGDYAALVAALLDVDEAGSTSDFLDTARQLQNLQLERFTTPDGKLFETPGETHPFYLTSFSGDAAEPSPYSVTVRNLVRLGALVDESSYHEQARAIISRHRAFLTEAPSTLSGMVLAAEKLRPRLAAN